jgi:hydroxyethylthiazole kinase-like uncharacterized protein yjeF
MKIFSATQIRVWDNFTIQQEPISSIDLMERASRTFVDWFVEKISDTSKPISIFCGQGNNGGDGLAIARILQEYFYQVEIYICKIGNSSSPDFSENLKRLPPFQNIKIHQIEKNDDFPKVENQGILIDAIFGSGLNRSVEGYWGAFLTHLNQQHQTIVSVDIPSGVFADQPTEGISIHANFTFSFQAPKLAFLFPENENRVGEWDFKSINLHPDFLEKTATDFYFLEKKYVQGFLKRGKNMPTKEHLVTP